MFPPPPDRFSRDALTFVLDLLERAGSTPIYPRVTVDALDQAFDTPLPRRPRDACAVLGEVIARVAPACRNNNHPRMLGYVNSPALLTGIVGDLLASALNQNVTSWRSAPGATTIERQVVRWLAEMVGFPADTGGLLVSGGSMANLTALAVALRSAAGADLNRLGVRALAREPVVYASPLVHMSIGKGLELLGLGRDTLRFVPTASDFRMDPARLDEALTADRTAGRLPIAVVASAGDVNMGTVDPLDAVADVCARHGVWLHVDGAYGGFASMAPRASALFAGIGRADSLSLDPHKWLFAPIDVGCVLVRDVARLRGAFTEADHYVSVLGGASDFAFWDHGFELSRRFRALKVWMMLTTHGVDAFAAAIDENIRLARSLGDLVDDASDFERLAPVPLGIVCFRYLPPALRPALASHDPESRLVVDAELDRVNRAIVIELQSGGYDAYCSNTIINGAFALRCCIANFRTSDADLPLVLDAVRAAACAV